MRVRILLLVLMLIGCQISISSADGSRETKPAAKRSPVVLAKQKRENRDIRVTMYMTSWCPYCRKARVYLKELGVNLTEYDVEKDPARAAEMKKLNGGSAGVPLISVEGILIPGFAPDAIKEAVEKRKNGEVKG